MHSAYRRMLITLAVLCLTCGGASSVIAADKVRATSSQRGFWDTTLILWGQEQGFFKDENIDLEIVWTEGGADEVQASVSGSVDITTGTGIVGVIGAWAKGAPIRIISAEMTGPSDLFWYVKADSPIKALSDLNGKTVAFSRPGSSTDTVAQALIKLSGTNAKALSTGGPAATLTQVLTNQVDVGWSAGVVNYDRIDKGARPSWVRIPPSPPDRVASADLPPRFRRVGWCHHGVHWSRCVATKAEGTNSGQICDARCCADVITMRRAGTRALAIRS